MKENDQEIPVHPGKGQSIQSELYFVYVGIRWIDFVAGISHFSMGPGIRFEPRGPQRVGHLERNWLAN